ncbi:MAG: HAD-IIIA family hydrolase [Euryarchaeota archaeon]
MSGDTMLPPHRESAELTAPLVLLDLPGGKSWDGRIAYLDRDGVINVGSENYVNSPAEVELLPDAGLAIGKLRRAGYRIVVVTNQSPIGRGHWNSDNLDDIHSEIRSRLLLEDSDAHLDLILFSPYAPWEGAWARKPNSGMLEAGRQLMDAASSNADFASIKLLYDAESTSFMVGDRGVDMAAAENFGVRGIRCDPDTGISGVVDSILGGVA